MKHDIWRRPAEETSDYPGLWVADNRVSGSITDGQSRLPLRAYIWTVAVQGFDDHVVNNWPPHGMTGDSLGKFLFHLLNQRGEFARLLCVLADMERLPKRGGMAWWERKKHRARVIKQLQRCIAALEQISREPIV